MGFTFLKLAEETFKKTKIPMSATELWDKAKELKLVDKLSSTGATPQATLSAQIYTNIKKNGENSLFVQVSKSPPKFYLREYRDTNNYASNISINEKIDNSKNKKYSERDLHPLLASFVYSAPHFKCYTKTIYHENSKKSEKGKNKWLHPDIVGVYYPFDDYDESTISVINALKENSCKLFSFEMKKEIDFSHLREYYFQAVSNSSWANEGYIVALDYSDEVSLIDEMRRLNNSFGIGFIKLNPENIEQSEILFTSKIKDSIDWETVNRLVEENSDFREFIEDVTDGITIGKIHGSYDEVLEDQKYQEYIKNKFI